jgi:two-component system sensor histidine kinase/response regulator
MNGKSMHSGGSRAIAHSATLSETGDKLAVFDRALALSRVGGDLELLREIAHLFLEDSPNLLRAIESALEAGEADRLERAAHSLKGAVANFGAPQVYQAALHLEMVGRGKDLATARRAFERLESSLKALQPELKALAGA